MVARALLQPNTDIYDFDPKKVSFQQAMRSNSKDKWTEAIAEEVDNQPYPATDVFKGSQ